MTKQEIATHKRLRLACEFLGKLATNEPADLPPSDLSEEAVAAIRDYETTHLQPGDLIAIRSRPGHWCLTNPYQWLWVLHRYQNKYQ
jgi:hypothetical protein